MIKSPAEVISILPKPKVLERLKSWFIYYEKEIKPLYPDSFLNLKLLRHAVESCLLDLARMKNFHGIEFIDSHKRAAFTMLWITRAHPIQIATNANMTEALLIINEIYAFGLGINHMDINMRLLSPKYIRNMLYILHFRNPTPEILASEMYVLDCALKKQFP